MTVQKIEINLKVTYLLASIGNDAFTKLETLVTPRYVTGCTYKEIKEALVGHYQPKPLVTSRRHDFRARFQKKGESFADFLADLKKLSKHCGFDNNDRLEEEISDQITQNIRNETTKRSTF